jgi:Fe-S oxidoreductase
MERVPIPPKDTLWSCTTCSTCQTRCPKELNPYELIIEMRSAVVEEGRVEPTIRNALESVFKHGNPWDRARGSRSEWAKGLDVKQFSDESDILYYVGCTPAYDPRCQKVARSLINTFNASHVEYGTLANEETCCGSSVYGMGEKGLFTLLVEENTKLFEEKAVEKLVTTSPHCYHTFKNRYGKIGFQVQHYSQFLAELIDSEKLQFTRNIEKTVTYHDPCFLGRENKIYDTPRKVLESIPGIKFVEMDRSRERSLCCEGGGGRMWIDIPGEKLAEKRVMDAVENEAEIIATACPFCLSTIEDAVLTSGHEGIIQVMDIIELVNQAL